VSRTGVEPKPAWRDVPRTVREEVRSALGSDVVRGARIWGGCAPTPTYRLLLADGRRAFFKAIEPGSNEFMRDAFATEQRVYRELPLMRDWAPEYYRAFHRDGWSVLLLEDLGPQTVPPWTRGTARMVMHAVADFHRSTLGRRLPSWLPRLREKMVDNGSTWSWAADEDELRPVARLADGRASDARRWLDEHVPVLASTAERLRAPRLRRALLHGDLRSDNLRWTARRLYLLDWPHVSVGPPEDDVAMFAQTIVLEGGPDPETLVAWYAERLPVDRAALDAAVAALGGFFAYNAWREELPGLPRLRLFQRQQLRVTLRWAAQRLGLREPGWLEAVPA
jgi:fructosamine-3-kinase